MTSSTYQIIAYRPEFADAVARLHTALNPLHDLALSASYLQWKYDENPYLPERLIHLALYDGAPVAMRGCFGSLWEIGGKPVVVPCMGDLVIAPEHRDRSLFTAIMRKATADLVERGFEYIFNLSGSPVTAMAGLAQGFRSIASVDQWGRSGEVRNPGRDDPTREIRVEEELRPGEMAELIAHIGDSGAIRHRRDETFLTWRYRNPLSSYRFVYSHDRSTGCLGGYLAIMDKNEDVTWLMDWEARNESIAADLLDAALALTGNRYLLAWAFGIPDSQRKLLEARGFEPSSPAPGLENMGIRILVKRLGQVTNECPASEAYPIFDTQHWDYRMVYADCF